MAPLCYHTGMRCFSWNVNGARAVYKKGAWDTFLSHADRADVIGLQELKASEEQLPEALSRPAGYHAFFNTSKEKRGYSGVALYTTRAPARVEYSMGMEDGEGRFIGAFFEDPKLLLCNVYFPNGGGPPERMAYKLDFYDAFLHYVDRARRAGWPVLFMGDINAAHTPKDLAHPAANEGTPGYNPEVRAWLDEVERHGYVDTFRALHPEAIAYTYWDMKTRARERNVGWRIDYVFISVDLLPKLKNAFILSDIHGSDHCPIGVELDL